MTPIVEAVGLGIALFYLRALTPARRREFAVLALAGLFSEELSMTLYDYYGYGDSWTLMLHRTPVAVVFLWPVIILSSLCLVRRVPRIPRALAALLTGALVLYDALVIEPVATNAGIWWWKEGGYFGVPVLGVVGWGFFAVAAAFVLKPDWPPHGAAIPWRAAVITLVTQMQLAPLAFPSIAADVTLPLSQEAYAWIVCATAVALTAIALRLRRRLLVRPGDIRFKIAGATLFFALLYGLWIEPLVLCCSVVPVPYLALTLRR